MGGLLGSGRRWSSVTSCDSVCPFETKVAEYGDYLVNVFRAPAGVGQLCLLTTTVNLAVYQGVLDHSYSLYHRSIIYYNGAVKCTVLQTR